MREKREERTNKPHHHAPPNLVPSRGWSVCRAPSCETRWYGHHLMRMSSSVSKPLATCCCVRRDEKHTKHTGSTHKSTKQAEELGLSYRTTSGKRLLLCIVNWPSALSEHQATDCRHHYLTVTGRLYNHLNDNTFSFTSTPALTHDHDLNVVLYSASHRHRSDRKVHRCN